MLKQLLHDGWTVRPVSNLDSVPANCRAATPANVPGCVHTDLLRVGKIVDPYHDRNEPTLRWIGQTDWRYETSFTADAKLFEHERIDLAADGLDTVARIELNGQLVGDSENMHVGLRFDVKKLLRPGPNTLAVTFSSAEHYAFAMREKLGTLPHLNTRVPFNFIRKMSCNFGWDWGPELITCGIWRGIRLEGWSGARIKSIRPVVLGASDRSAVVDVHVDVEIASGTGKHMPVQATLTNHGKQVAAGDDAVTKGPAIITFNVQSPKLWWPKGHGDQPLYELKVVADGDQKVMKIGLRTIELDTSPDDIGRKFVVKVNGKPIFCKGFNWIPDDVFLDRACDPQRVRTRLQQALDANANMLRVWGGGIFETDEFYDICDEMGMLVWQDLLFACAAYAEEEPMRSLVEQEVRYNVARLSHHASLAIWNGCNENIWGYHDWGWKKEGLVNGRTWGPGYYFDVVPKILKELDPARPYWAASPWSGDEDIEKGLHPNLASHGNKHVWEPWFGEHYVAYRRFEPRFCSEFGFQGPATYASIASVVPMENHDVASASMRHRQKSVGMTDDGDRRNLRHLLQNFELPGLESLRESLRHPQEANPVPIGYHVEIHVPGKSDVNFDKLHYLLTINQARALTVGVEWFRSRQPTCMGALYWQLNDCWPGAMSWSAIDGDGRPKPLWFATRRFYAPRLLTIQPLQDKLELCAVNDSDEPWNSPAELAIYDMDGTRIPAKTVQLNVAARGVQRIPLGEANILRPDVTRQYLVAQAGAQRAVWYYVPDKELRFAKPSFDAEVSHSPGMTKLKVVAKSLLRDVLIQVDRLDPAATISENFVTLLPGESMTFDIRSEMKLTRQALTAAPVFLCANEFGKQL